MRWKQMDIQEVLSPTKQQGMCQLNGTLEDELEALKPIVKKCMEEAVELSVPLVVDISAGSDWLEAH